MATASQSVTTKKALKKVSGFSAKAAIAAEPLFANAYPAAIPHKLTANVELRASIETSCPVIDEGSAEAVCEAAALTATTATEIMKAVATNTDAQKIWILFFGGSVLSFKETHQPPI